MNKWTQLEEITSLPQALAHIDALNKTMAERAYLHPLDLATNIQNIQHAIPNAVSITIGKEAITFFHAHLDATFSCIPAELPDVLDKCEFLKERIMR